MGLRQLAREVRRLGLGSALAILRGNLRRYGWQGTLRKMARRVATVDSIYEHHGNALQRQAIAEVDSAPVLFGAPSVLVVGALDLPQCKKYRVLQKVEYCDNQGWASHYASYLDEARVLTYLQLATTLVLYRIPDGEQLDAYVNEARRLGVQVLYDIDDPIFDAQVYSQNRNLDHLQPEEKQGILASVPLYHAAMAKADGLVLSTRFLAALAREHFEQPVYVWRNLVDASTLSTVEALQFVDEDERGDRVVIAYTSGSRAHEEDFREAAPALLTLLGDCNNVVLRVIGYAQLPGEFSAFGDRVEQRPFSSYQQYLQALGDADICIVPLLADRFNACKSAIRYLEAALCGVSVIASKVGQFEDIVQDGADGVLVPEAGGWEAAIRALVQDSGLRSRLGEAARRKVLSEHQVTSPSVMDASLLHRMGVQ